MENFTTRSILILWSIHGSDMPILSSDLTVRMRPTYGIISIPDVIPIVMSKRLLTLVSPRDCISDKFHFRWLKI